MKCRALVAVILLALVALEILPFSCEDVPLAASGVPGSFACQFEPLQVCDGGDTFLGPLAGTPFVVPGSPVLVPPPAIFSLVPDRARFVPGGFTPAIDHPPQLSA